MHRVWFIESPKQNRDINAKAKQQQYIMSKAHDCLSTHALHGSLITS